MAKQASDKWELNSLEGFSRYGKVVSSVFKGASEKPKEVEIEKEEILEGRGLAILAYIPILCFVPFLFGRRNRFAYEHGKLGVALFLFELVIFLVFIFWRIALFIAAIISLVAIFYAIQGKVWRIPFISEISDKFDISD